MRCSRPDCFPPPELQAPLAPTLGRYSAIAASWDNTCGVRDDDRKLVCWGASHAGQDGLPLVPP